MNIVIKSDVLWIRPVPTRNQKDGIQFYVPKLETETNTGIIMTNIMKGQGDYQFPPNLTADDVADVKVGSAVLIDFK